MKWHCNVSCYPHGQSPYVGRNPSKCMLLWWWFWVLDSTKWTTIFQGQANIFDMLLITPTITISKIACKILQVSTVILYWYACYISLRSGAGIGSSVRLYFRYGYFEFGNIGVSFQSHLHKVVTSISFLQHLLNVNMSVRAAATDHICGSTCVGSDKQHVFADTCWTIKHRIVHVDLYIFLFYLPWIPQTNIHLRYGLNRLWC